MKNDDRRDSTGRKVIEVTKEFHEISISDTETESELNTTNEEAGEEVIRRGEKEKVRMEEEEETDAAPTRQMAMPKVDFWSCPTVFLSFGQIQWKDCISYICHRYIYT